MAGGCAILWHSLLEEIFESAGDYFMATLKDLPSAITT